MGQQCKNCKSWKPLTEGSCLGYCTDSLSDTPNLESDWCCGWKPIKMYGSEVF